MHAVALTARQRANLLLLVGPLEVERGTISARVHFLLAEQDYVIAFGNFLPNGLLAIEAVARLVHVAETHRLTDLDRTLVRLFLSGDHAEQGCFTGAVRADHADDTARRQFEG